MFNYYGLDDAMEITKMKVFIYMLTFAAYSWSGYGSNVLGNLRDAVLSAEGIFGDVLEKVTDVFRTMNVAKENFEANIEEECVWSCPDGKIPLKESLFFHNVFREIFHRNHHVVFK